MSKELTTMFSIWERKVNAIPPGFPAHVLSAWLVLVKVTPILCGPGDTSVIVISVLVVLEVIVPLDTPSQVISAVLSACTSST